MKKNLFKTIIIGISVFSILCFSLVLTSCSKKQTNTNNLVKRNGLLYKSGSNVPYSGREKSKVLNRIIEYDVVNGVKQGEMKIYYSEGKLQIAGQMVNNKNEGLWKYYYENFQVESEGNFKNDIPVGMWTWYYLDGKVKEKGNYVSGKRDGKWITYSDSGKSSVVKNFKDGELVTKNK